MKLSLPGPSGKKPRNVWAREILWYRLRYRLSATTSAGSQAQSQGILPVGNLLQNAFNLKVAAWRTDASRRGYQALVRATHPISGAPVGGVNVKASITFDESNGAEQPLSATETTDANGFATLHLGVSPADLDRDAKLAVEGRLEGYAEEAEQDFSAPRPNVLITTDKPLYQPGQVVHVRALVRTGSGRALSAARVVLTVTDPSLVYRSELTTSRFGVAHGDWSIPDHARLGTYVVQVQSEPQSSSGYAGNAYIRISHYELPQFTVSVKPDRAYCLPGQDPRIEVHGDYLFGKPVVHGRVKVVGAEERTWNREKQKFDTKEGPKYEGEADAQGVFTVLIDLKAAQKVLAEKENESAQYLDVH
jgi:uncharacterized protein YfaS (alpha-2-macroglobulin family)